MSATAIGIVCLTCSGIYYFDPALIEQRYVAIDLRGDGEIAVGGDTTFVLDREIGDFFDASRDGTSGYYWLFALLVIGCERWCDGFLVVYSIDFF